MRLLVIRWIFLLLVLILAACRPSAQSTPQPPTAIPDDVIAPDDLPDYGLVAGGIQMVVVGAVAGTTDLSSTPPLEYSASVSGMRQAGTNDSGNVGIEITAQLDSGEAGVLLLEFAPEIGIGTHQVGTNSDLNPAPVGASFRIRDRVPFTQRVSGTLTLDFVNRHSINGEFNITLLDANGQSVTVSGAFHRVPFTPREVYSIQLSGVYSHLDFEPQFGKGLQGDARFITLYFKARRAFAEVESGTVTITAQDYQALQAGEYDVLAGDSPVTISVQLGGVDIPVQSGTVLFIRTHDIRNGVQQSVWQGAMTLSLRTAAGTTTLTGLFNHFDAD